MKSMKKRLTAVVCAAGITLSAAPMAHAETDGYYRSMTIAAQLINKINCPSVIYRLGDNKTSQEQAKERLKNTREWDALLQTIRNSSSFGIYVPAREMEKLENGILDYGVTKLGQCGLIQGRSPESFPPITPPVKEEDNTEPADPIDIPKEEDGPIDPDPNPTPTETPTPQPPSRGGSSFFGSSNIFNGLFSSS